MLQRQLYIQQINQQGSILIDSSLYFLQCHHNLIVLHIFTYNMSLNIKQAKAKAISENPFYGLANMLNMQKFFEKVVDSNVSAGEVYKHLTAAWKEATSLDKRQLFFMIIFSGGDIANREHNLFSGIKVDQGGQAKRKAFRLSLDWILNNKAEQFYDFLPLIAEYTNYENLFYNQIRTDRYKGAVLSTERLPINPARVAEYLRGKILDPNTTEFELGLIAKFLPKVPQSKRWRKDKAGKTVVRSKKPATLAKDRANVDLIHKISEVMGFEIETHSKNTRYKGYEKFRSAHLANTEAHLFSSKKITTFDKVKFLTWLEGLPSGARFRVQCRIVNKENSVLKSNKVWKLSTGEDMGEVYLQWMRDKETAMKKLVSLTEEAKNAMTKTELRTLEKQAKVTTGGTTIFDAFVELYKAAKGKVAAYAGSDAEVNLKLQTLVDKVKLDVPVMVCIDSSGSMGGVLNVGGANMDRIDAAKLFASIMLYKNPNPELASTFMRFSSTSEVYSDGLKANAIGSTNRYMTAESKVINVGTIADTKKPFTETLRKIDSLFVAGGATHFGTVADTLKKWVDEDPQDSNRRKEIIQGYPVWVCISDGDLNGCGGPNGTMADFQMKMRQWFGAEPVVVVWDIIMGNNDNTNYFQGLENVIHLAGVNPGIINQLFYNIDNLDVIDIYTQLKSLFSSSRYQPVKGLVA
jgi:hypothetical protein